MKINISRKIGSFVNILMVILLVSTVIFSKEYYGRYVLMVCLLGILVCDIIKDKFLYKFKIYKLYKFLILFIFYIGLSVMWSSDPSATIVKVKTLLEIFLMVFIVYNHYSTEKDAVSELLKIIKYTSHIVSFYTVYYFGLDHLLYILRYGRRLESEFANVNTIGMLVSVGILIQINEIIIRKKLKIEDSLILLGIFIISLTQSRKSLLLLGFGVIFLFWASIVAEKLKTKHIINAVIIILFVSASIYTLENLPFFAGLMKRVMGLINVFTGEGQIDESTSIRLMFIRVGLKTFFDSPVVGNGFGSSGTFLAGIVGKETYFHNNFVEILSSGGIIGFVIYYGMYFFVFFTLWKYRKKKNSHYAICFAIAANMLIMDMGIVTYANKMNYIYMAIYFLEIVALKRDSNNIQEGQNDQEINKIYSKSVI